MSPGRQVPLGRSITVAPAGIGMAAGGPDLADFAVHDEDHGIVLDTAFANIQKVAALDRNRCSGKRQSTNSERAQKLLDHSEESSGYRIGLRTNRLDHARQASRDPAWESGKPKLTRRLQHAPPCPQQPRQPTLLPIEEASRPIHYFTAKVVERMPSDRPYS